MIYNFQVCVAFMFLVFLTSGGGALHTFVEAFMDNTRMEPKAHDFRIVSGLYLIFRIGVLLSHN